MLPECVEVVPAPQPGDRCPLAFDLASVYQELGGTLPPNPPLTSGGNRGGGGNRGVFSEAAEQREAAEHQAHEGQAGERGPPLETP